MSPIVCVSIERNFDDYEKLCKILNSIEFSELCAIKDPLLDRYAKEFKKTVYMIDIDWKNTFGSKNVKMGKFGPYNADAPKEAGKKVAEKCTHYVTIGIGDFGTNKACKEKELEEIEAKVLKQYIF